MPEPEPAEAPRDFTRGVAAQVDDVDRAGGWVVSRINTADVDEFATVILPGGMRQQRFERNNRLVLWNHGEDAVRGKVPIGRSAWVRYRKDRDDLLAKTVFAKDEFSRGLFDLYRENVLRAWSVNGRPVDAPGTTGPPTADELRKRPDWSRARTVYRAWDLSEYSAVAFPGNLDAVTEETSRALADAVRRGLWVPESLKGLAARAPSVAPPPAPRPSLPPLRGRTFEQVQASVLRQFDEAADRLVRQAAQDALDLAKGRV